MNSPERHIALIDDFCSYEGELPCVEFKVNNADPDRMGTLIAAISNAAAIADERCGYVVWGIEDATHNVVGTTFRPVAMKAHQQPLELWLAQNISPSLHFKFHEVPHANGRVVLLEIPAASQVPTKWRNLPYIRIGSATPKLADHASHEASLLAKLRPFAWEQGVAKSFVETAEVISLLDVAAYFTLTEQPVPGTDEAVVSVLAHDKLVMKDVGGRWNILNLGAILFARDITKFESISRKAARVIRYDGPSRTSNAQDQSGLKGYAVGFDPMVAYINKKLPRQDVITRSLRVSKPEYPELAIRELVANALVHQDMTISGAAPVIEIFSDRIEITNPGIPLVATDRFIDFPPRSRNEALAKLMRRIGVCEEQGSGIDKVIDEIETARLPPADFRVDGNNTKAIIFGKKTFAEMTTDERIRGCFQHAVLKWVSNDGLTNASLRVRFGVAERNASQISRVIKQTQDSGLIKPSDNWSARSGHYLPYWA